MGKIHRLPAGLANQIAAGEVVERPASAVKELVENALDAGAARIAIVIEEGGKRLVRVEDDGEGMSAEDAALALERHATSKLARVADLSAIATNGFRGEALPSIASVSRLTLRTRPRGAAQGTLLRMDGGEPGSFGAAGAPHGTIVEVADLFYNVPARRKFLKSDAAEARQVSRVMTQIALANPEVGFRLASGRRQLLACPPVQTQADRFFQIYGERTDLVEVGRQAGGIRLTGYAASLAAQGSGRSPQNIFVNRRPVRDRTIAHAIGEAYSRATIKPRRPEVHLFLELPPDRVDVNVHPTKAEVRFLEQSLVHEILRRALRDALGEQDGPELALRGGVAATPEPVSQSIPGVVADLRSANPWAPPAGGSHGWGSGPRHGAADALRDAASSTVADSDLPDGADRGEGADPPIGGEAPIGDRMPLVPLGQLRDTFIIAVDNDGLAIVDQHVAHERILFEQVMARLGTGRLESQRLLEPLLVELPPAERAALEAHAGELARLGFEVEPFGGASVRVAGTPALLPRTACAAAVRELAGDLDRLERDAGIDEALGRIAATTACHAAVKANDRLTPEKMTYILSELRRTAYSTVCPHGRPVMLRVTREELERRFERT
ncbi:MAG: DNA mismatch repair endonuclease MutL [Acidobacteria bacterium]|nr:DNA mismatch repair endonuclease MutL [Acidobacteriota bacterium]